MKSRKSFFIILLSLMVLMAGSAVLYRNLSGNVQSGIIAGSDVVEQEEAEFAEGEEEIKAEKAPDFTVYDFEGNEVCSLISTDDFAKVTDFIDLEVLLENIPTQEF